MNQNQPADSKAAKPHVEETSPPDEQEDLDSFTSSGEEDEAGEDEYAEHRTPSFLTDNAQKTGNDVPLSQHFNAASRDSRGRLRRSSNSEGLLEPEALLTINPHKTDNEEPLSQHFDSASYCRSRALPRSSTAEPLVVEPNVPFSAPRSSKGKERAHGVLTPAPLTKDCQATSTEAHVHDTSSNSGEARSQRCKEDASTGIPLVATASTGISFGEEAQYLPVCGSNLASSIAPDKLDHNEASVAVQRSWVSFLKAAAPISTRRAYFRFARAVEYANLRARTRPQQKLPLPRSPKDSRGEALREMRQHYIKLRHDILASRSEHMDTPQSEPDPIECGTREERATATVDGGSGTTSNGREETPGPFPDGESTAKTSYGHRKEEEPHVSWREAFNHVASACAALLGITNVRRHSIWPN